MLMDMVIMSLLLRVLELLLLLLLVVVDGFGGGDRRGESLARGSFRRGIGVVLGLMSWGIGIVVILLDAILGLEDEGGFLGKDSAGEMLVMMYVIRIRIWETCIFI